MQNVSTSPSILYKNTFAKSSIGMLLCQLNENESDIIIADCNNEAAHILQLNSSEIIGCSLTVVFPHIKETTVLQTFYDVLSGKIEKEHFNFTNNEKHRISDVTIFRVSENIACVEFKDITHELEFEKALQVRSGKFQVLLDSFPIGVLITDEKGEVTDLNKTAKEIAGFEEEEGIINALTLIADKIIIDTNGELISIDDLPTSRALRTNTVVEQKLGFIKNGITTWLSITAAPVPLSGYGVAVAFKDITDQINTERELSNHRTLLQANLEELRISNSLKNELLSILAHDIRSPFHGILGFSSLITGIAKKGDNAELIHLTEELDIAINQHYSFVNDLLEWIRFRQENDSPTLIPVNIDDVVGKVFATLNSTARSKRIKLRYTGTNNLTILGETNMLALVLRNLVSNAIKFSPKYAIVTIIAQEIDEGISVSVVDEGVGIDKNRIAKLFNERFSTRGTQNEKGSGLGLKLVHDAITQMGGTISVKSELGFGTKFTFIVPKP